ncbi:uncharacterized protein LOC131664808 [Phymastichus coffea]|uniref:uncharacterized protein LOC131664808 n=1 Tax=Phymastichus coffea TaxID=108790 RepID=UPI00273B882F|nr:uncharacterized protein LOC131664808 [Phymastichus coffea]
MGLLKILPIRVRGPNGIAKTYALLDGGSTITVVDQKLARNLGLRGQQVDMTVRGLWSGERHAQCEQISFEVEGKFGVEKVGHALAVPHMDLPTQSLPSRVTQKIADELGMNVEPYINAKPLILIGQDNWSLLNGTESRSLKNAGVAVSRTALGWVMHGYLGGEQNKGRTLNVRATVCVNERDGADEPDDSNKLEHLFRQYFILDNLGVSETSAVERKENRAMEILRKTTRKIGKTWETGLLWKNDTLPSLDTRATALKRLRALEKRQDRDPIFAELYHGEMRRLIDAGYAVKVKHTREPSRVRYVSHFGVENPNKPGRVRLVFDAAEKTQGVSMNDLLDTGPDLLESLLGVLTRFRQYPYAVKADIKDMYLRVRVIDRDRDSQRFLYRGANRTREPDEWEMTCLIFGSKSSPCSALYVKNTNAERFSRLKPTAANSIKRNSYMDDYLASGIDENEMKKLVHDVTLINSEANFELHGWASNENSIVEPVRDDSKLQSGEIASLCNTEERVLGLYWDRDSDDLRFNVGLRKIREGIATGTEKPTKREVLSVVMSVYDPLGILSPFTLNAKLIIQDIWTSGVGWDAKIRDSEFAAWSNWLTQLKRMSDCKVPRSFIPKGAEYEDTQLHVFCDASKKAFAAAAYLRITDRDAKVHLALVMAKTRVAPVKPSTIPRLELQAALLGARLAATIEQELDLKIHSRTFWSDSTTVLHWIKTGPRTKQIFVANRLSEINLTTRMTEWRWVPTKLNPADDGTRKSDQPMLSSDRWLVGPKFLREKSESWPERAIDDAEKREADMLEAKKVFIGTMNISDSNKWEVDVKVRLLGWSRVVKTGERVRKSFYRWYEKTREKLGKPINIVGVTLERTEDLVQKQRAGEKFWYRVIQSTHFSNELDALRKGRGVARGSKIISLRPYIDEEGLLRARGRVVRTWDEKVAGPKSENSEFENRPIILDANHYLTKLLIAFYHKRQFHGSNETIVNEMRQKFYTVGLRTSLRWLAKRCITCRLRRAQPQNPPMADLPECRLAKGQRPFTHCGLDYFGPMYVKIGRARVKRWGVLFTCMTTRAIHLELASTLSASSTILAVRRLAGRRGYPRKIYSDNGTNFIRANKELNAEGVNLDVNKQQRFARSKNIAWHFNPPDAPHMGGAWERLVRSVKIALSHVLNEQSQSEEVLSTLMVEIEHMVNSRPLTHVSVDPDEEEALTPNHFLIGRSSGYPDTDSCDMEIVSPRRTFEITQNLANGFWKRWLRSYLPTLLPTKKWHRNSPPLQVGDVVMIIDHQAPRNTWKIGKITEVYINKTDGVVRSAKIRAGKGFLDRPVHKLIKLLGTDE